jgi:hypothetical protein
MARRRTGSRQFRRVRPFVGAFGLATAAGALQCSAASASNRMAMVTATTSSSGAVLLALGGGVLVLGGIGFVVFTWSRRRRRPGQCAAQREALELAERVVRYWEGARAHLVAAERQRAPGDVASVDPAHASQVAKAVEGLRTAIQQRDQRQLELIHCMAAGVPAVPLIPTAPAVPQPFFMPGTDGTSTPPTPV